jgi:hypothetical protein
MRPRDTADEEQRPHPPVHRPELRCLTTPTLSPPRPYYSLAYEHFPGSGEPGFTAQADPPGQQETGTGEPGTPGDRGPALA